MEKFKNSLEEINPYTKNINSKENPSLKRIGNFLWLFFDKKIIDGFGPDGISSLVISISRNVSKIQTGYVYHYAFAMLIGLGFLLIRFAVY